MLKFWFFFCIQSWFYQKFLHLQTQPINSLVIIHNIPKKNKFSPLDLNANDPFPEWDFPSSLLHSLSTFFLFITFPFSWLYIEISTWKVFCVLFHSCHYVWCTKIKKIYFLQQPTPEASTLPDYFFLQIFNKSLSLRVPATLPHVEIFLNFCFSPWYEWFCSLYRYEKYY